jgi:hypothetical protein
MAIVTAIVAGTVVSALSTIFGGIMGKIDNDKGREEARRYADLMYRTQAKSMKDQRIQQNQQNMFQQQQLDTQQGNLADEKQFREEGRSFNQSQAFLNRNLQMINQSNVLRNNFRNTFNTKEFQ